MVLFIYYLKVLLFLLFSVLMVLMVVSYGTIYAKKTLLLTQFPHLNHWFILIFFIHFLLALCYYVY